LPSDINAAFRDDLAPMTGREQDWEFVGGVDLGLKRDASAVVVLGVGRFGTPHQGKIRLAAAKLWLPRLGKKVDLMDVEQHIRNLDQQYNLLTVGFDSWQAELLGQRLEFDSRHRRRGQNRRFGNKPWMKEIPPSGANLRDQASLVIESFSDRRLQFYDYPPLRNDLLKLRVSEKSYGVRLESPRDADGHGDTFSAFSLALFVGHEQAGKRKNVVGGLDVAMGGHNLSTYERVLREHEFKAERYQDEMQFLHEQGSDDTTERFAQAIRNHFQ